MHRKKTGVKVSLNTTLKDVIACIESSGVGAVVVVDRDETVIGYISDGDLRRAYVRGVDLKDTAEQLLNMDTFNHKHITFRSFLADTDEHRIDVMQAEGLRHLPVIDARGKFHHLAVLRDLLPDHFMSGVKGVVMAGGYGRRLKELTKDTPKPMLAVGEKPQLENIVDQLKTVGVENIEFTTHYKSEVISDYFGDGSGFGVSINYICEEVPLGTAGGLKMVSDASAPMFVINGDIVSTVDYKSLLEYHKDHEADITLCVHEYDINIPYGVVECSEGFVSALKEKPKLRYFVNGGIYVMEHSVKQLIPENQRFDMTDLINVCLQKGLTVASFPIIEYWLDIGSMEDYHRVQKDYSK